MKPTRMCSAIVCIAILLLLTGCGESKPQPTDQDASLPVTGIAADAKSTECIPGNSLPDSHPSTDVTEDTLETTAETQEVITSITDVPELTEATEATEPASEPASTPTEPKPTEPKPTEPKPSDPKPTETKPTEHVHSWSGWKQSKAPTCGAEGEEVRTCSCGAKESRTVAATGKHSWQETPATCTQDGNKSCKVCGKKESIPALGHDWVHQDEEGHWQTLVTCYCGMQFNSEAEWYAHASASPDLDYADAHAGFEAHEIWVVDKPGRDVCSRCGTVK